MKAVILAGGFGTRLAEETDAIPKPMVEVGGMPIICHIMKSYAHYGVNEFIICAGYKGYILKEYFLNYHLHASDVTFDTSDGSKTIHASKSDKWKVTVVDTGLNSMTGGRLARVKAFLAGEDHFCFTYGDGVSDVDIKQLIDFHLDHGKLGTVTAVKPPARFGALDVDGNAAVNGFIEKPLGEGGWINGGYFVLSTKCLDLVTEDSDVWEQAPLETLARDSQLNAFLHDGFWCPMDTLRDKRALEDKWNTGKAPWARWLGTTGEGHADDTDRD